MNENLKVGIMTIVTLALLIFMVFKIGDLSFSEKGYSFTISYYNCSGLSKGSGVSIAGYRIGKVTGIELVDDQVLVHCYISDKNIHIRRKSTFSIQGEGLMGDKHVEIIPTRDYTSPYVAPNEVIAGSNLASLDQLVDQGSILLKRLEEITISAKEIIGDPDLKDNTKTIFRNARNATDHINEITASLRDRSDHIIESLDKILSNVNEEIEKNRNDIKQIVENFKKISKSVEDISSGSKDNLKDIIANIKSSTEKIDAIIAKLNENDKLTMDVRETMSSLKDASENAKEITKEVKELIVDKDIRKQVSTTLDDAHKLAQAVDKVFLNIRKTRVDFKYTLRYQKESKDFLSDINVDIYPNESSFFRVGVDEVGGDDKINAMLARDANTRFIKRAGIMKSKIGLGIDYLLANNFELSVNVIDTKDTEVQVLSKYRFNEHVAFEVRVDDANDDEKLNFGMEYVF